MNIGFVSTRIAGVDGVSLEIEKWATVLTRLGHTCYFMAGELATDPQRSLAVPTCHFQHPAIKAVHDAAFSGSTESRDLYRRIADLAGAIKAQLYAFVDTYHLDCIIPQNAQAIPMNIPLGVALRDFINETHIPTIGHHHDFYWERDRFLVNRIPDILRTAFPAEGTSIQHVVISTAMRQELFIRRKLTATYIPNVFDFAHPPAPPDEYSRGFRADFGIAEGDVLILQPTRIIRRKNIERAVELVELLQKSDDSRRYQLVVTGYAGDEGGTYFDWLQRFTVRTGITAQFIGERVGQRGQTADGSRTYGLWDIYPNADLVTYPSSYEGFGNALIETLYFRIPLMTNAYHVYRADIQPTGIQAIEIYEDVMPDTVEAVKALLNDPGKIAQVVEHNYQIGVEHFSYEVLQDRLVSLLP
ncbi:MAG: glycosyltransferase family 4 protein [Anaerolineae bacterium]|nr:glycosyltransferase family 4 protein [Anaerolineae bacterium]